MTHQHAPRNPSPTTEHEPQQGDMLVKIGRSVILLATAGALGYLSFWLLFVAGIALSGCFLSCSDPSYGAGALAAAGLSVTLAGMATAATAAFARIDVRTFALRAWMFSAGLSAIGAFLVIANP